MSKLKLKNFGPIREGLIDEGDDWLEIGKVTVLIGNQGSGKSTVAKVIATLAWLEKAINRGDIDMKAISFADFWNFFAHQRVNKYFKVNTEIDYIGQHLRIRYARSLKFPEIERIEQGTYAVPKIMYVPAERNFLSVIEQAYNLKKLPGPLFAFAEELRKGQIELGDKRIPLPVGDLSFTFDATEDASYLIGNDYKINLLEASSGYQSLVPLFLVSAFITDELAKGNKVLRSQLDVMQSIRRNREIASVMLDENLSDSEKKQQVETIDARYINTCFINIVEEPEQNLFPSSQWQLLKNLLSFNNRHKANQLIMTTHSPYIINYVSIAIQGGDLSRKIGRSEKLLTQLHDLVPAQSLIFPEDVVIYEFNETNGTIKRLPTFEGIPSDQNYLNASLAEGNQLFDSLLEIEQEL